MLSGVDRDQLLSPRQDAPMSEIKQMCSKWAELQNLDELHHPDEAAATRVINDFNGTIMNHFRKVIKRRQKQVPLDRYFKRKDYPTLWFTMPKDERIFQGPLILKFFRRFVSILFTLLDLHCNSGNEFKEHQKKVSKEPHAPLELHFAQPWTKRLDKLEQLRVLNITSFYDEPRCLQSVLEEVTKLPSLEVLDLSNNQIDQLPDRLDQLKQLKVLKITGSDIFCSPLQSIPEAVTKLTSLEVLDLSYNKISQLPVRLRPLLRSQLTNPLLASSKYRADSSTTKFFSVIMRLSLVLRVLQNYSYYRTCTGTLSIEIGDGEKKLLKVQRLPSRPSSNSNCSEQLLHWPDMQKTSEKMLRRHGHDAIITTAAQQAEFSEQILWRQQQDALNTATATRLYKLQRLKVLKITGSDWKPGPLQSVPEVVTKLPSLEVLDLSYNEINQLPDRLDKLKRLKVLKITGSSRKLAPLQSVPEVVTKLTSLEEIDISCTRINHLPDRFDKLQKLKVLKMRGYGHRADNLLSFPEVVTKLPLLELLDFSGNFISQLPERIHFPTNVYNERKPKGSKIEATVESTPLLVLTNSLSGLKVNGFLATFQANPKALCSADLCKNVIVDTSKVVFSLAVKSCALEPNA
ncbi:leucine-rich repeat and IQ domain-containing protein 4-like [Watersipora subatra]|uniref:leucine-rich repeat and IQ domain-containing protein 4-like n=1 Tax=Watersipora subatra TaxID=2589382 RepID=UPI00355C5530